MLRLRCTAFSERNSLLKPCHYKKMNTHILSGLLAHIGTTIYGRAKPIHPCFPSFRNVPDSGDTIATFGKCLTVNHSAALVYVVHLSLAGTSPLLCRRNHSASPTPDVVDAHREQLVSILAGRRRFTQSDDSEITPSLKSTSAENKSQVRYQVSP